MKCPVENEVKFVLDLKASPIVKAQADKLLRIRQGYLSCGSARIRESVENNQPHYQFTYKQKVSPGVAIEIEKDLNKETFDRLSRHAKNWLSKIRAKIDGWDIDTFVDPVGTPYFCLAEIELPEHKKRPDELLEVVRSFLLLEVPRGDSRFSSKKLSDRPYAQNLYRKLLRVAA